ncbi:hypothetical protein D3C80_1819040 [compost metagenome]
MLKNILDDRLQDHLGHGNVEGSLIGIDIQLQIVFPEALGLQDDVILHMLQLITQRYLRPFCIHRITHHAAEGIDEIVHLRRIIAQG